GPPALPEGDWRPDRAVPPRVGRQRHRLSAAQHEASARARAALVSLDEGPGAMKRVLGAECWVLGARVPGARVPGDGMSVAERTVVGAGPGRTWHPAPGTPHP